MAMAGITPIDTLTFSDRMVAAGMPKKQADTLALAWQESFTSHLATKDDLRALEASIESRFEQIELRFEQIDKRFEQQEGLIDSLITMHIERAKKELLLAMVACFSLFSALIFVLGFVFA